MPVRQAVANWSGDLLKGNGSVKLGSGAFEGQYNFSSRFESGVGTNPEELIGAAHAGCFSMALSGNLARGGFSPEHIHTTAKVHIERDGDGFTITLIELETEAKVPGVDNEQFQKIAEATKNGCPVSRALAATKTSMHAKLVG